MGFSDDVPTSFVLFDDRRGTDEGKEYERVLACFPYDLSIDEQTVLSGLALSQVSFLRHTAGSSSSEVVLRMRNRSWVMEEIEEGVWLALILNRSLWGKRDGPKDNILREFTSWSGSALLGAIGSIDHLLQADPTGTEVRLAASPILGALVGALEDVECPLSRAFLSSPLAEGAYPRVLPWGDRTRTLCQLLRQELITWSGSRLRRRVMGDGTMKVSGGEHSAHVMMIYTARKPQSGGPAPSYLIESSLGSRDTQVLHWMGIQGLCQGAHAAEAEEAHRAAASAGAAASIEGAAATASSWFKMALGRALNWGSGGKARPREGREDRRAESPGRGSSLRMADSRGGLSGGVDSPRSLSSIWGEWMTGTPGRQGSEMSGGGSGGRDAAGSSASPKTPKRHADASFGFVSNFLATDADAFTPRGSSGVSTQNANPHLEGYSRLFHQGYAFEGSYRRSSGGSFWDSPAGPLISGAEQSYRGGDFTWANSYQSVAIMAQLQRSFAGEAAGRESGGASTRPGAAAARLSSSPSSATPPRSAKKAGAKPGGSATRARRSPPTTPFDPAHWRPVHVDVEIPRSGTTGPGASAQPPQHQSMRLAVYLPTRSRPEQFGGCLPIVHLRNGSEPAALVPVRTGPVLFLVAVPLVRLEQSVDAMMNSGKWAACAQGSGSGMEDPAYVEARAALCRERAAEVVAGVCGDVVLKVADQLAAAAAADCAEVGEGDLRGLRYLARNCDIRQCMATPERRAARMSAEASEALEALRAGLYECCFLGGVDTATVVGDDGATLFSPNAVRAVRAAGLGDVGRRYVEPGMWNDVALTFSRSLGITVPTASGNGQAHPSDAVAGTPPPPGVTTRAGHFELVEGPDGVREACVRAADGTWVCALERLVVPDAAGAAGAGGPGAAAGPGASVPVAGQTFPQPNGVASANGSGTPEGSTHRGSLFASEAPHGASVRMLEQRASDIEAAVRRRARPGGDAMHRARRVQLFLITGRRETKQNALAQLRRLAQKLDM